MQFIKFLKNKKGFSLVELMAAVAIIGVLAAIAIPNYTKYKRRALQSEAKYNLGATYMAESTIFAEFNSYSACLGALAFAPEGQNYYAIGFADNTSTGSTCGPFGSSGATTEGQKCITYSWKKDNTGKWDKTAQCAQGDGQTYFLAKTSATGGASAATQTNLGATLTYNTFEIHAAGAIGGSALDTWAIDNTKQVYQKTDGVK